MDDTAAALAAPFLPPPSPLDMVPAIRWAFREAGNGAHLVDVLHHVEEGGHFNAHHSLVAAEKHGRQWSFQAIEGVDLDDGSADLLAADLMHEYWSRPCHCRIDETDMAAERQRLAHASLEDHDWDQLRRDGYMAAYVANANGEQLVLDCRTCVECRKSFSRTVPATTDAALAVLRAEGLVP